MEFHEKNWGSEPGKNKDINFNSTQLTFTILSSLMDFSLMFILFSQHQSSSSETAQKKLLFLVIICVLFNK